jgi:hypothetical protein
MIEAGARQALQNLTAVKPYVTARPTNKTIELCTLDSAAEFMGRHRVGVVEPLKVISRGSDWLEAWNQIWHW